MAGPLRRAVVGLVLRSALTVVGNAVAGVLVFAFVVLVTELALVEGGWIRILYPPYVLLGGLVGANLGVAKAMRREARLAAEYSGGAVGLLADRAVRELAIPAEGIETERLRALAELRHVLPSAEGRLTRAFAGFAMARALQTAGVAALREQLLRAASEAEAQGLSVVSRDAVREAARNGVVAAFVEQLDAGWGVSAGLTRVTSALALLSLPVLALLFG